MTKSIKINKLYLILKDIGLNEKDSLVYFELLKQGPRGLTVNKLYHILDFPRTTIYSILNKLKELGCVKDEGKAKGGGRQATNYIAVQFSRFLKTLISNKEQELKNLKQIEENHSDYFDSIYKSGFEYTIDDVNVEFQPYIIPLLEKGWKIVSFDTKVWEEYFEYKVYDCKLMIPYAKYIKDKNSIHLFEFKYNIEQEKNALKSMINSLKRKTEEIIGFETGISEFELQDTEFNFLNKNIPGLVLKAKIKDLKQSSFFSDFSFMVERLDNSAEVELWRSVIMSFKNKVFFVWAENLEFIGEMLDAIDKIEKISEN